MARRKLKSRGLYDEWIKEYNRFVLQGMPKEKLADIVHQANRRRKRAERTVRLLRGRLMRTGDELLWDVALRGIGIGLPDEYVIRFHMLLDTIRELGMSNVTIADMATVEHMARNEMESRLKEQQKED